MDYLTMYKTKETKTQSARMIAIVIRNGFEFTKQFVGPDIPSFSHKVYSEVMDIPCPEIRAMFINVSGSEYETIKRGYYKA